MNKYGYHREALDRAMQRRGISQEMLARELGITKNTMCRKINSCCGWWLWEVHGIAEILCLTEQEVKEIFFQTAEPSFKGGKP